MPELPEVETVCRTLKPALVGRRVENVRVYRPSVIHGPARRHNLLCGVQISELERHGKQLALHSQPRQADGPCVCIHLGMTGSLQYLPTVEAAADDLPKHVHLVWYLDDGGLVLFRDPRRFGGVWTLPSRTELWQQRWQQLGPDALGITPGQLYRVFKKTSQGLKTVLLDQHAIAGLGNIYVDELLFGCKLHPLTSCRTVSKQHTGRLVSRLRRLLNRAIRCGGSSTRDYVDAKGQAGRFQNVHRVYGRAGLGCVVCDAVLDRLTIAGRTTVFCPCCQPDGCKGASR